jgi:hypothetical protein
VTPLEPDEHDSDIERDAPAGGVGVIDLGVVQIRVLVSVRRQAFFEFGYCRRRDDDGS